MCRLTVLTGLALALAGLLITPAAGAAPGRQGGPVLNVVAGQGDGVIKMQGFVPATLRVEEGTTITWTVGSDEEHSVAFLAGTQGPLARAIPQPEDPEGRPQMLNPRVWDPVLPEGPYDGSSFINSGALGRDQTFSVTLSTAGSYPFICTLHPNQKMTGVVEVVPPGSPGITTQQQADAEIAAHMATEHQAEIDELLATRGDVTETERLDGTSAWAVRAGTARPDGHLDIEAFLPAALTVRSGDTVTWNVDHNVPHTVTFLPPGQRSLETVAASLPDGTIIAPGTAIPDPSVKPRMVTINREPVVPGPAYDGVSLFSSGQFGGPQTALRGTAWSLTFDAPGTFRYVCLLHEATGMRGSITVEPR